MTHQEGECVWEMEKAVIHSLFLGRGISLDDSSQSVFSGFSVKAKGTRLGLLCVIIAYRLSLVPKAV